jgi:FkbM family methyltransferase
MDSTNPDIDESRIRLADGREFVIATDAAAADPVCSQLRAGHFPLGRLDGLLRKCVPPGGRVLDLGGHVGSFALAAAAGGYDVVCVEASPANASLIRRSIAANGFSNLRLENVAVSDREGTLTFYPRGPYGHLAPDGETGEVRVEAVTVDSLLARIGWERADFIKLDIEGSEVAAIRGMQGLLARADAPLLFCESNGHMLNVFGESTSTLKAALRTAGLVVHEVQEDRLLRVAAQDVQCRTVVDYFACKALPAPVAAEASSRERTTAEQLAELARTAQSPVAEERRFAARTLRDARPRFAGEGAAEGLRRQLAGDTDEQVRGVAGGIAPFAEPLRAAKRWWNIFG